MAPDYKIPFVVTHKKTGIFVKHLVDRPAGTRILGSSQMTTFPEWMEMWGRSIPLSKGTYKKMASENVANIFRNQCLENLKISSLFKSSKTVGEFIRR